jgi:hypothetical protein
MRLLGAFLFMHTQKLIQKIPVAFVEVDLYLLFWSIKLQDLATSKISL